LRWRLHIGGIIGGSVPVLFILWMGNVFAKQGCPSPMKPKPKETDGVVMTGDGDHAPPA